MIFVPSALDAKVQGADAKVERFGLHVRKAGVRHGIGQTLRVKECVHTPGEISVGTTGIT